MDVCIIVIYYLPNGLFTGDYSIIIYKKIKLSRKFNHERGQRKCFFVIVVARVLQLCAYVHSSNMKDQSTVVRLKNDCVFVDFSLEKFSMH